MKTLNEIIKEECEKMYPEFLQRDCNDLLVILAGRLQVALSELDHLPDRPLNQERE